MTETAALAMPKPSLTSSRTDPPPSLLSRLFFVQRVATTNWRARAAPLSEMNEPKPSHAGEEGGRANDGFQADRRHRPLPSPSGSPPLFHLFRTRPGPALHRGGGETTSQSAQTFEVPLGQYCAPNQKWVKAVCSFGAVIKSDD